MWSQSSHRASMGAPRPPSLFPPTLSYHHPLRGDSSSSIRWISAARRTLTSAWRERCAPPPRPSLSQTIFTGGDFSACSGRLTVRPPEALSSHLLDCEYDRVQSQVHEAIGKADSVAIMCSGWSDIKEAGSVIYAVATPAPLFYKCTKTKEQTHTDGVIAEQLKEIINEVGSVATESIWCCHR